MNCPNKNTAEWKYLSYAIGEDAAMGVFHRNGNQLPTLEEISTRYPRTISTPNNSKVGLAFMTLAEGFKQRLGVDYKIVSENDIKENGKKYLETNPDSLSIIDKNGIINFISERINDETLFHEFAHPIMRSIRNFNKPLFDSLVEETARGDQEWFEGIRDRIKDEYPELTEYDDVNEETLVYIMGRGAMKMNSNISAFEKLWNMISDYIKTLLHIDFNTKELSPETTLQDLSFLMIHGTGKIELNNWTGTEQKMKNLNDFERGMIADINDTSTKTIDQMIVDNIFNSANQARHKGNIKISGRNFFFERWDGANGKSWTEVKDIGLKKKWVNDVVLNYIKESDKTALTNLKKIMNSGINLKELPEDISKYFTPMAISDLVLATGYEVGTRIYNLKEFSELYPEFRSMYSPETESNSLHVIVHGDYTDAKTGKKNYDISLVDLNLTSYEIANSYKGDNLFKGMNISNEDLRALNFDTSDTVKCMSNAKKLTVSLMAMKMKSINPDISFRRAGALYINRNNKSYEHNSINYAYAQLDVWKNNIKKLSKDDGFVNALPSSLASVVLNNSIYNQEFAPDFIMMLENQMLDNKNEMKKNEDRESPTLEHQIEVLRRYKETGDENILYEMLRRRKKYLEFEARRAKTDVTEDEQYVTISIIMNNMVSGWNTKFTNRVKGENGLGFYFRTMYNEGNEVIQNFSLQLARSEEIKQQKYNSYADWKKVLTKEMEAKYGSAIGKIEKIFTTIGPQLSEKLMKFSDNHPNFYVKDRKGNLLKDKNGNPLRKFLGEIYFEKSEITDALGLTAEDLSIGKMVVDKIEEYVKDMYRHNIMMDPTGYYKKNEKTGTYDLDMEKIEKHVNETYDNNWTPGMLPLISKSTAERVNSGQIKSAVGNFFRKSRRQYEMFDDMLDQIYEYDDSRVRSLFANQLYRNNGSINNRRANMLGLVMEGDGSYVYDERTKNTNDNLSVNIETIMDYFSMDVINKTIDEQYTVPAYEDAKVAIRARAIMNGIVKDEQADLNLKKLNILFDKTVHGKHVPIFVNEKGQPSNIDGAISYLSRYTSFSRLAFSVPVMITSFTANQFMGVAHMFSNQLSGDTYNTPSLKDYTEAIKLSQVTDRELSRKLFYHYGVWDKDMQTIMNDTRYSNLNKSIITARTLNYTNWVTDISMRQIMFIAQMVKDGTFYAHSLVDDKIVYDETKDERLANIKDDRKQLALKIAIKKDLMKNPEYAKLQENSDKLIRAYSIEDIEHIRAITGKFIIGAYGARETAAGQSYTALQLFTKFKQFLNTVVENRLGAYNEINSTGKRVIIEDNGEYISTRKKAAQEGSYRTAVRLLINDTPVIQDIMKKLKLFQSNKKYQDPRKWNQLEDWERYNVIRTALDVATFCMMYGAYLGIGMMSTDEEKKQGIKSWRMTRAFENGILTTIALSPWEIRDIVSGGRTPIPIMSTVASMVDILTFKSVDGSLQKDVENLTMFSGTRAIIHDMDRFIFDDEITNK